ncbi:MAG: hypothetical protein Q4B54_00350, partial [Coriobacteriales bacterium]|nr:hypothetical protein [Coriobacteriales bacterium]
AAPPRPTMRIGWIAACAMTARYAARLAASLGDQKNSCAYFVCFVFARKCIYLLLHSATGVVATN